MFCVKKYVYLLVYFLDNQIEYFYTSKSHFSSYKIIIIYNYLNTNFIMNILKMYYIYINPLPYLYFFQSLSS